MKRVLALALALVLSLSVGVVAFAADEVSLLLGGKKDDGNPFYIAPNSTTTIVMDVRTEDDVVVLDAVTAGKALDDNYLKVSFKATKGSEYIKSYEFKKSGTKQLMLEIKTVEVYLGKVYDMTFEVKMTFTKVSKIAEKVFLYTYKNEKNGYVATPSDLFISLFGKYDTATVKTYTAGSAMKNNDYILTKEDYKFGWNKELEIGSGTPTDITYVVDPGFKSISQLILDKKTNLDDVRYIHIKKGTGDTSTLDFDSAYVEVKFSDNPVMNMYYSEAAVKAITSKFADVDFQFWDWRGKPALDFTASVELYVDEDLVGEDSILYYWDGTSLTKVNADYEDATFTFRTRQLGTYVAANKEISITAAPVETTAAAGEEGGATTAAGTGNPHTGVSDFVGVAVALAVVSMAAAGAVALKK